VSIKKQVESFQKVVLSYYHAHKRSLPWRKTADPYHILVSEVMLQQTQVPRVIEKYKQFIKTFPTINILAAASMHSILNCWQGLGYNRRALWLKKIAQEILENHHGIIPQNIDALDALPGIGRATAASICAFAFNQPTVFIETNIRSVFIHHFFDDKTFVNDLRIVALVKQTLYRRNPRQWYWALMDYGTSIKKNNTNPNRKSAHYHKQTPFIGSHRQLRGKIIRALLRENNRAFISLQKETGATTKDLRAQLKQMHSEHLVQYQKQRFFV